MDGLPDAVLAMDLNISRANSAIRVGTHGNGFYEGKLRASPPTDVVDDRLKLPAIIRLLQNYPNPFNPETVINFEVPALSNVRITIYDILGRQIETLVNQEHTAGQHSVKWDGKDAQGVPAPSGVYVYRLQTDTFTHSKKMLLLR